MNNRTAKFLIPVMLCVGATVNAQAQTVPRYQVDPWWPKQLPNNWITGQIAGIAVDPDNHIWVLQRPRSNTEDELGAAQNPPLSECCSAAPPVLEFDVDGELLKFWGGPGPGYDWPETEHGIWVERDGSVWIGGNGAGDRQILKFTDDGEFILQIGHPSTAPMNSADVTMLGRPAAIEVDEATQEVFVADGYGNRRVIVFDSKSGAFKRMWGAYGNVPSDAVPGAYNRAKSPLPQFQNPVHCVRISKDGLVYVCDRISNRIQVFTKQGTFVKEFFIARETLHNGSVWALAFSNDPDENYLFLADGTNNVIWTLRRSDGSVLGKTGHSGRNAGQFHWVHQIASDSAGNLYTGEVDTGKRLQKFVPVGGNRID